MDNIIKAAGVLCMCGYITGLQVQFVPLNKTEKSLRLVVTLYIISAVFSPAELKFSTPEIDLPATDYIQNDADEYVINELTNQTEEILSQRLSEKNICYTDIDVHINKQTDKLYIDQIIIYGADNENMAKSKDILSDVLNKDYIISGDKNEQ